MKVILINRVRLSVSHRPFIVVWTHFDIGGLCFIFTLQRSHFLFVVFVGLRFKGVGMTCPVGQQVSYQRTFLTNKVPLNNKLTAFTLRAGVMQELIGMHPLPHIMLCSYQCLIVLILIS